MVSWTCGLAKAKLLPRSRIQHGSLHAKSHDSFNNRFNHSAALGYTTLRLNEVPGTRLADYHDDRHQAFPVLKAQLMQSPLPQVTEPSTNSANKVGNNRILHWLETSPGCPIDANILGQSPDCSLPIIAIYLPFSNYASDSNGRVISTIRGDFFEGISEISVQDSPLFPREPFYIRVNYSGFGVERDYYYFASREPETMLPHNRSISTPVRSRVGTPDVGGSTRSRHGVAPSPGPFDRVPMPAYLQHIRNNSAASRRVVDMARSHPNGDIGDLSMPVATQQPGIRQEQLNQVQDYVADNSRVYHHDGDMSVSSMARREHPDLSQVQVNGSYHHDRNKSASSSKVHQDRGRQLQKKPDFSWDELDGELPGVSDNTYMSNVTTMSEFINAGGSAARSMSRHKSPPKAALAMSLGRRRPEPLDLQDTRKYAAMVGTHANIHPIHNPMTPHAGELQQALDDGSSSVYTGTPMGHAHVGRSLQAPYDTRLNVNILQTYSDWRGNSSNANGASERRSLEGEPNATGNAEQGLSVPKTNGAMDRLSPALDPNAPPFTPLTPFIMGGNVRKASKTMIGEKGWLEDTAARVAKKPTSKKSSSFFTSFKKTARKIVEMTEFKVAISKSQAVRDIPTSLDPREQSLLYCELGFNLSNALSSYINTQFHSGRLNPHILAKISDIWEQQGRPKVYGFRYDLETQIDLIAGHVGTFRFYGPDQTNHTVIKALLYDMKMNARVMRIHTYCQPDSVIAKHIMDSQRLLHTLNAPEQMQISLEEVSQFFKAGVERENARRIEVEMETSAIAPTPASKTTGKKKHGQKKPLEQPSSPKETYPGAQRVKNQANLPESERQFSGPVLEPKTFDSSSQQSQSQLHRQDDQGRPSHN